MSERVYNFSAGPAALPLPVLQEAQKNLLNLPGAGASILEISHRSKIAAGIFEQTEANIRALFEMDDQYTILFLQGGASLQFSMIPMSFLANTGRPADYLLTGSWGAKAVKEAKRQGDVRLAWSGKDNGFVTVPCQEQLERDPDAAYLHYTSNETIEGVEFQSVPDSGDVPLICDASSDIFSRPVEIDKHAVVYAGAQKNAGPAGVTLVIIRKDMLEKVPENHPSMLDYRLLAEKKSMFNTPPVFSVYIVGLVTKWLLDDVGGLDKMFAINQEKATLLYNTIDSSDGFYLGHAKPEARSLMNISWKLRSEELDAAFVSEAANQGLATLKGHRSLGGIRASIYNAMPIEGVSALVEFMNDFRSRNG